MHIPFRRNLSRVSAVPLICLGLVRASAAVDQEIVQLTPFEVRGETDSVYAVSESNTGTIISKPRDVIPFVTSVLTSNAIADLRLDNPADFATQFAGVAEGTSNQFTAGPAQQSSGTGFTVRGFPSQPLYNGFQTGLINVTTEGVDRVEVTKGPNSILYGQSSAGGTINFVPKGALLSESFQKVSVGASTNDGYRGSAEVGGVVSGKTGTGFRLGASYQEFTREQQFYWDSQTSLFGAYRTNLTDRITLELNGEGSHKKATPTRTEAFVSLGTGPARVTDPLNRQRQSRTFSYSGPWNQREQDTWISSGYLTAKLGSSLTLRLGGLYSRQDENSNTLEATLALATAPTATGYYQKTTNEQRTKAFKVDLLHQAQWRSFKFDSIVGYESNDSTSFFDQVRTNPAVTPMTVTIPLTRSPVAADYPPPPAPNLYTTWSSSSNSNLNWTNIRLTQFVTAPEEKGTLMWGVAYGEGEDNTLNNRNLGTARAEGSKMTYTIGATYLLHSSKVAKWTVSANNSTSFLIQSGNQQNPQDFNGFPTVAALRAFIDTVKPNPIDPQTGEGSEVGIRYARTDGLFRVEVVAFQQERANIARQFFVRESNVAGVTSEQLIATYQLASGREQTEGLEVSVDWNPSRSLTLYASALISNGEVKSNPEAPAEEGFRLFRSPEKMGNIWVRYSPVAGALQRFSLGIGGSYRSPTRTYANLEDRYRLSDEYFLARAMMAYRFGSGKAKHTITLNVDNLLDEDYVAENAVLSEPSIYRLSYGVAW